MLEIHARTHNKEAKKNDVKALQAEKMEINGGQKKITRRKKQQIL